MYLTTYCLFFLKCNLPSTTDSAWTEAGFVKVSMERDLPAWKLKSISDWLTCKDQVSVRCGELSKNLEIIKSATSLTTSLPLQTHTHLDPVFSLTVWMSVSGAAPVLNLVHSKRFPGAVEAQGRFHYLLLVMIVTATLPPAV